MITTSETADQRASPIRYGGTVLSARPRGVVVNALSQLNTLELGSRLLGMFHGKESLLGIIGTEIGTGLMQMERAGREYWKGNWQNGNSAVYDAMQSGLRAAFAPYGIVRGRELEREMIQPGNQRQPVHSSQRCAN